MMNKIRSSSQNRADIILYLTIFMEIINPILGSLPFFHTLTELFRFAVSFGALFVLLIRAKGILFTVPVSVYLIWTIYVYVKNLIMGYGGWGSPLQMYLGFVSSSICLFSCVYSYRKNEAATIRVIIAALYIFCIYTLLAMRNGSVGFEEERLGGDLINANAVGIRASLIFFFVIIQYLKKRLEVWKVILLLIIPFMIVMLSGSRTAFAIMILFASIIIFQKKVGFTSTIRKLLLIIVTYLAYGYIMDDTLVGERLAKTSTQVENSSLATGTFWDVLGDRGFQYYVGLPHIYDNFLFGIGSGNAVFKIPEMDNVFHSEYLIQLIENGTIAAILYFYVYFWIIKGAVKLKSNVPLIITFKRFILISMIALLFACLVTRISYYGMYSCVIAYMIFFLKDIKIKNI